VFFPSFFLSRRPAVGASVTDLLVGFLRGGFFVRWSGDSGEEESRKRRDGGGRELRRVGLGII
jgi:hypothetical protein